MSSIDKKEIIQAAIRRLLKPLVRVMIDSGMSYQEFDQITKNSFVEVADKEFPPQDKKQTISRIAMMTGINRKEVQHLKDNHYQSSSGHHKLNRAAAVVSAWHRDKKYKDKALAREGDLSFKSLVKKYSGDIPPKITLDELLRVGAVKENSEGLYELVNPTYIPTNSKVEKFTAVAEAVKDLVDTGYYNMLQENSDNDRLQLSVTYRGLRKEAVDQFKLMSDQKNLDLIMEFDNWLSSREVLEPEKCEELLHRVGVGIFYIETDAGIDDE